MGFQRHVETILAPPKNPGTQAREAAKNSLKDTDSGADANAKDAKLLSGGGGRSVQMLLFSATMAGWICNLTSRHMKNPIFLDAVRSGEARLPASIKHLSLLYPQ
ncbi:hypothetical protein B484DRAFT_411985, partial [Ochromonadaceae sp. CCMP2298]